jgi:DNA-binding NarL/FixJ family response regulator
MLLLEDRLARRAPVEPERFAELEVAAQSGGPLVELNLLTFTGWSAALAGDFEAARARARRAIAIVGDEPVGRTRVASLQAYAAIGLGAFDEADAIMAATLRMLEASEHVVLLANTLVWYARFALLWNDVSAARDYAERGRALARELDLPAELAGVELALAEVFARVGDRGRCDAAAKQAVRGSATAWYASDRTRIRALATLFSARAAYAAGDPHAALAIVREALTAYDDVPAAQRFALAADRAAYAVLVRDSERRSALGDALAALVRATATDALDAAQISDAASIVATIADQSPQAPAFAPSGSVREAFGAYITARIATQQSAESMDALVRALRPAVRANADPSKAPRSSELTPREDEILQLIAQGLTNREIAQRFTVSPRTVDTHVERVLSKLGANSRTRAVATAMRLGLVAQT